MAGEKKFDWVDLIAAGVVGATASVLGAGLLYMATSKGRKQTTTDSHGLIEWKSREAGRGAGIFEEYKPATDLPPGSPGLAPFPRGRPAPLSLRTSRSFGYQRYP